MVGNGAQFAFVALALSVLGHSVFIPLLSRNRPKQRARQAGRNLGIGRAKQNALLAIGQQGAERGVTVCAWRAIGHG